MEEPSLLFTSSDIHLDLTRLSADMTYDSLSLSLSLCKQQSLPLRAAIEIENLSTEVGEWVAAFPNYDPPGPRGLPA